MPPEADSDLLWWAIPRVLAGMPMPYLAPERRLRGGLPLAAYADDLPRLYRARIRAVVSLLDLPEDGRAYRSAGLEFLNLPIANGMAPSLMQVMTFEAFVDRHRAADAAVAVHCAAGRGRTGTMIAAYLIAKGDTPDAAIAQVRRAQPEAIETELQERFLAELPPFFR